MIATLLLFLSLGLDAFAVAVGLGLAGLPRERWVRICLTFAAFEGLMPIVGLLVGQGLSETLGAVADYLAAGLLVGVGPLTSREALSGDDDEIPEAAELQGMKLVLTGLSVSLDELAVGFSLGVLDVPVGPALAYVAVQAFAVTFLGLWLGRRVGARLGNRAELAAGIVLVVLGVGLALGEVTGISFL